jgi:hypothetical protein
VRIRRFPTIETDFKIFLLALFECHAYAIISKDNDSGLADKTREYYTDDLRVSIP